jgi:hypothetical protein
VIKSRKKSGGFWMNIETINKDDEISRKEEKK